MTCQAIDQDMSLGAHGQCAQEVSLRYLENYAKIQPCLTTTGRRRRRRRRRRIIIVYMKPGKNKIPSPFGGWDNNSVDETREEQDPIPLWGMG